MGIRSKLLNKGHRARRLADPDCRGSKGRLEEQGNGRAHQIVHWLTGDMGVEELRPAPNDYLQRWVVSKRVNSSKADKDDATLIEPIRAAA